MADCLDFGSCEEDLKITLVHNEFNGTASLKDLTFTSYDNDLNDQKIVWILDFDKSKVSIEGKDDNSFKVLYNNKPFFVNIKVFWAVIKKGKHLTKHKYIEVKNPLASLELRNVFSSIEVHICQETHSLAFFADAMKVLLESD